MDALKIISGASMKEEKPAIAIGDTVKVHCKTKRATKREFRSSRAPSSR